MSDIKQICMHFITGNCKYGDKCTKAHVNSSPELLLDIEKKGTAVCIYHPSCKFTSEECKRLHIIDKNFNDINELRNYYQKIMEINTTNSEKITQINRIKKMIQYDLIFLKDSYEVLKKMN